MLHAYWLTNADKINSLGIEIWWVQHSIKVLYPVLISALKQ